jgi:hypothetical protein
LLETGSSCGGKEVAGRVEVEKLSEENLQGESRVSFVKVKRRREKKNER